MKARLYFAAVLFYALACVKASHRSHCFLGLTQISLISLNLHA